MHFFNVHACTYERFSSKKDTSDMSIMPVGFLLLDQWPYANKLVLLQTVESRFMTLNCCVYLSTLMMYCTLTTESASKIQSV
jgi:hypothetical protein